MVLIVAIPAVIAAGDSWQKMLSEGDNDLNLQKLARAEQWYRQALKTVEQGAHSDEDLVTCLEKVAAVLALEDKTEEAVKLYQRSLHILEGKFGHDSPKVVPTLFSLGSIYESEGDPKLAMNLYKRALAINEKHYGPISPAVANSLHRLGRATFSAGQPEVAERHYRESLSILMQDPALSASKQLQGLLSDYSDLLRKKDTSDSDLVSDFQNEFLKSSPGFGNPKNDQAASAWQGELSKQSSMASSAQTNESQEVMRRAFNEPMSSSTLQPAYGTMSEIFQRQHSYKEEEARYQKMVAIDMKALGPDHPTVADDLYGLVLLYISQRRYEEAKPLLVRALGIYQSVYGSDSLLVKTVQTTLASVCQEMGNTTQAAALYNNALNQERITVQPNKLETARILNDLGFLYFRQGKLEDAGTIYQWALASTEAAAGKESVMVAACLRDYANVLSALGRQAEASKAQARAMIILANVHSQGL